MIFAAGKGTRLKPLTDIIPKALVPVGDMPLIQRVYLRLVEAGAERVVVNVHHHAEQLKNYCEMLSAKYGVEIVISDESEELLETGGALKHAAQELCKADRFIIHNCDILSNVDLKEFWYAGEEPDATLLVSERETQRYLIFDDTMRLVGWTNVKTEEVKSPFAEVHQAFNKDFISTEVPYSFVDFHPVPKPYYLYAFAGIHQMHSSLLKEMDHWPERFSVIDFYLEMCATHDIRGYIQPDLQLLDVGKLDTLQQADGFLLSS